jgi:hypothetical protein
MPSDHVVSTAELLTDSQSIACPGLTSEHYSERSSRLLSWVVALTERTQRYLARAAEADARASGVAIERLGGFANDVAAAGFRSAEAARGLRAPSGWR